MKKLIAILIGNSNYKKIAWSLKRFGLRFLFVNIYSILFENECIVPNGFDDRGLFVRLGTTDMDVYDEVILSDELNFHTDNEPSIILDCGAHIGLVAMYFSIKYPNTIIYAIEAEESNYEILKKNSRIYTNICPIHRAVWENDSYVKIDKLGKNNWGYCVEEVNYLTNIQGISIDELFDIYKIAHVDIMKMDIEGSELEVFADSDKWIEKIDIIIIETHDRFKSGCKDSVEKATESLFSNKYYSGEKMILSKQFPLSSAC